jgi:hypothetical protein
VDSGRRFGIKDPMWLLPVVEDRFTFMHPTIPILSCNMKMTLPSIIFRAGATSRAISPAVTVVRQFHASSLSAAAKDGPSEIIQGDPKKGGEGFLGVRLSLMQWRC